jgi:hypothetical protein
VLKPLDPLPGAQRQAVCHDPELFGRGHLDFELPKDTNDDLEGSLLSESSLMFAVARRLRAEHFQTLVAKGP